MTDTPLTEAEISVINDTINYYRTDRVDTPVFTAERMARVLATIRERDARLKESAEIGLRFGNTIASLRHQIAALTAALDEAREGMRVVLDTFKRAEDQGYRSKDRQFAITLLKPALAKIAALTPEGTK